MIMNKLLAAALVAGSLATAVGVTTTSAQAFPGSESKVCKTVKKIVIGPFGKSITTKRVCRTHESEF